jgi:hypothetical protein
MDFLPLFGLGGKAIAPTFFWLQETEKQRCAGTRKNTGRRS